MTRLENTLYLNFRHTTKNNPINTTTIQVWLIPTVFIGIMHEVIPFVKLNIRRYHTTSHIIKKVGKPKNEIMGSNKYLLIGELIIDLNLVTKIE